MIWMILDIILCVTLIALIVILFVLFNKQQKQDTMVLEEKKRILTHLENEKEKEEQA